MDEMPKISTIYIGLAGVFFFIALVMQFYGFFIIEPAWIGEKVGWGSMFFCLMASAYFYAYFAGTKNALRNTLIVLLAGLFVCTLCYVYGPQLRPSVKAFFKNIGVDPATGYKPRVHRRR